MAYNLDMISSYKRILSLPTQRSFLLFGPRGTGKSSLLEQWRHSIETQILWIDLLDLAVEARYATAPNRLKEQLESNKNIRWVVIDEVQKIPALLDVAHWAIEQKKIRFALTVSSARKLKRGAGNLLAGRADTFRLATLTHIELANAFALEDALHWGTLPGLYQLTNTRERVRFLESYVHTYMKEEIQLEQLVRNVDRFRQFLPLAAQYHGEPLQFTNIAEGSERQAE